MPKYRPNTINPPEAWCHASVRAEQAFGLASSVDTGGFSITPLILYPAGERLLKQKSEVVRHDVMEYPGRLWAGLGRLGDMGEQDISIRQPRQNHRHEPAYDRTKLVSQLDDLTVVIMS